VRAKARDAGDRSYTTATHDTRRGDGGPDLRCRARLGTDPSRRV